jgi:hypothetical protein
MQEMLASAQAEASEKVVVGQAGDGAVQIGVSGGLEFKSVSIDPAVFDQGDASLLEDLVLVALHDAMGKVGELNLSAMAHSGLEDIAALGDLGFGDIGLTGLAGDGADIIDAPVAAAAGDDAEPAADEHGKVGEDEKSDKDGPAEAAD